MVDLYQNMKVVKKIARYNYNWDDNGAEPFTAQIIKEITDLLYNVKEQPAISAMPNDTIQFEYSKDNGEILDLQINQKDIIVCIQKGIDGEIKKYGIKKSAGNINCLIDKFFNE